MKFTFKSEHEYGTTVEINFDEEHIDDIQEMFNQFMRGSGFYIPEDDVYTKEESNDVSEECVHKYAKELEEEIHRLETSEAYRLGLLAQMPKDKPWVGMSDEEINDFDKKLRDNGDYCSLHFAWGISAKLKERNGG
jgi:wyosine [tRNA(Phe)-imidazoG37] synthetase (radical SAM superfamily)